MVQCAHAVHNRGRAFEQIQYALYAQLKDGSVVVSADIENVPAVEASTVDYQN